MPLCRSRLRTSPFLAFCSEKIGCLDLKKAVQIVARYRDRFIGGSFALFSLTAPAQPSQR
jgi:hypothetical protein